MLEVIACRTSPLNPLSRLSEARVARVEALGTTSVMQRLSPLHTWMGLFVNDLGIAGTLSAQFDTHTFSWPHARRKVSGSTQGHLDELARVCRRQDPPLSERFRTAFHTFNPGKIRFVTVKEAPKI